MKNVLILGATSELAQAVARKYAAEGWKLTLAAIERDQLDKLADELSASSGLPVHRIPFDATDYSSHQDFYNSLPAKPDEAVCVFGHLGDQVAARSDFEEVRKTIDVNLLGMASILHVIAADFELRGHGVIAGFSSVAGERGRQGNYIYGSAKGGVTAYLSGLRARLAKAGVHVMTVIPGFCRTRHTESLKLPDWLVAEPEQVADAVYQGSRKKRNVIYIGRHWRWIMLLVRYMPERLFQRMAYTRFHY